MATEITDRGTAVAGAITTAAADATAKADAAQSAAQTYADGIVATEATARASAVTAAIATAASDATSKVAAEATARNAAILVETNRATAAESDLQAAIDAEALSRANVDSDIRHDYNATNFTMQSGIAATTHIVAHNLAADFVSFTVLVERDDGKYRNDIVSVEEFDSNTLKVYLAEAAMIKIAVHTMAGI